MIKRRLGKSVRRLLGFEPDSSLFKSNDSFAAMNSSIAMIGVGYLETFHEALELSFE
jgi:hypothetical protein